MLICWDLYFFNFVRPQHPRSLNFPKIWGRSPHVPHVHLPASTSRKLGGTLKNSPIMENSTIGQRK